ncbi:hypothetical protein [Candidatus Nitrosotenuis sp. DW1]|uniref:hypothetical protein n=1 Tax=Candidatus Nitrosotenuis sp. DW1 TaxID=2259672 RepID=UPI0015C8A533|nr:hypothetical protein [Candidatus Nitrosotenuis sp. DW1]QLH09049.1 hypothetical protein DSQ19_05795 [Candidatus Nitrosotenuis sp. DW1]
MTPFSSIRVETTTPLVFTMTQDASTGMWYTPIITFSDSTPCTSDGILKILCVNLGNTVNVSIIFKDLISGGPDISGPVSPPISVTDGGEGIDISTYTRPALFHSQLIACSTNPKVPGGPQGIDSDKDGLCDNWEKNGSIEIKDSRISQGIPYTFTCEPETCKSNKKDLFVEIDYMRGHKPSQIVINHIRDALASGPMPGFLAQNGVTVESGIDVHIVLDDAIPHKTCTLWPGEDLTPGFDQIKSNFYGTSDERGQTISGDTDWFHNNGWKLKRYAFHYVLVVDERCGSGSSGIAESWGNDVMISLGSSESKIGSIDQQEGTILHELGHNLDLNHGGGDEVNCKPNQLSVMSYSRQFSDMVSDRKLDFSRAKVGIYDDPLSTSLDESNLIDDNGLGSYVTVETTMYGPSITYANTGSNALDWDDNPSTSTSAMDLNRIVWEDEVVCDGSNGPSQTSQLNSYNEWSIVKFDARGSGNIYDGRPLGSIASSTGISLPGSQHSSDCIALNSIPEKIKSTAQTHYRICSAGRSITTDEFNWLNARYVADNLDAMIVKNPNILFIDKIITLVNDTNSLLQENNANSAVSKIINFNKEYGNKMDSDIYQLVNIPPAMGQNEEYHELTFENVNSMRKIRIDTLEKLIFDYSKDADMNQYSIKFQSITDSIDEGDMNSAIKKLLEIRDTYDDNTGDNWILVADEDVKTRDLLIQATDDILRSFGKAVNDPDLKSFKAPIVEPGTSWWKLLLQNTPVALIITAILAIGFAIRKYELLQA